MAAQLVETNNEDGILVTEVQYYTPVPLSTTIRSGL